MIKAKTSQEILQKESAAACAIETPCSSSTTILKNNRQYLLMRSKERERHLEETRRVSSEVIVRSTPNSL